VGSAVSGLNAAPGSDAAEFNEPAQKLALNDDADVIVCGAGPAGITAAITADRAGAKMQLFKVHGRLGGVWEGLQIAATAEQIGVRDGRRIHARYTMTRQGLIQGARQKDAVARVTFGVDIHADSKETNQKNPINNGDFKMKPYDIPLRALIAKDVDGLMMAWRCISGDFISHASYRVTGNSVAMSEAAGVIAALAAKSVPLPHEVDWSEGAAKLSAM
jgi:succinate dehydrogenase/fumarate reductase flavoprotein subunit